jgi:hypothetical protein
MRRNAATAAAVLAIAALAACAANPAPVPLAGSPGDLAALAGEWRGEYETTAGPRRSGSILFRLSAGGDSASGDVLMMAHPDRVQPQVLREGGDPWSASERSPQSQLLAITFVQASGGAVTGALAPYADPDCGCTLRTTFTGRLSGNTVDGTFTSLHIGSGEMTGGRWRVTRHSP